MSERQSSRVVGFTEPNEPRWSCLAWPTKWGYAWVIYEGDGTVPGSAVRGSGAGTLPEALEAAADFAKKHPAMGAGSG